MVDFILAGLSAGLIAFVTFYVFSFLFLGLIFGSARLVETFIHHLMQTKAPAYREQTA
jgi:hypothetical protein